MSVLGINIDYVAVLASLVKELESKDAYEPVFVRDFAPVDRRERFAYVRNLETGLPFKCILATKSFGSNIGNYQYIWKIPEHVSMDVALMENQKVLSAIASRLPQYHTRTMKREFISRFGRISPRTKSYVLREMYKELTGDLYLYGICVHNF